MKRSRKRAQTRSRLRLIGVFASVFLCIRSQVATIPSLTTTTSFEASAEAAFNNGGIAQGTAVTTGPWLSPLTKPRLVIAGGVKDSVRHLPDLHAMLTRIVKDDFDLVRLLLFENDSTDSTLEMLETWRRDFPALSIISEKNLTGTRTGVLAHVRNSIWREIVKITSPIDYVLMVDMDEVNYHLSGVPECLSLPDDWSVCCANQYTMYYDLWPLRAKDWLECDWLVDCPKWDLEFKVKHFRHISASEPPMQVDSCFGGAALYKYSHVQGLNLTTYSGSYTFWRKKRKVLVTSTVCEHWPFHASLQEQKPSLKWYIQPKFLNDGPSIEAFKFKKAVQLRQPEWEASHRTLALSKYYDIFLNK